MNWQRLFDFRETADEPKPFLDHIEDLRWMLIKMVVALVGMMVISFAFQNTIIAFIQQPSLKIDPEMKSLTNFGIADPLTIAIELSFYSGLVLALSSPRALPGGVRPSGSDQPGKTHALSAAGVSLGLFLGGVAFAYYLVLPPALDYFFNYSKCAQLEPPMEVCASIFPSPRSSSFPSVWPSNCLLPC